MIWLDFGRLGGNSRAFTAAALFFDWRDQPRIGTDKEPNQSY